MYYLMRNIYRIVGQLDVSADTGLLANSVWLKDGIIPSIIISVLAHQLIISHAIHYHLSLTIYWQLVKYGNSLSGHLPIVTDTK